MGEVFTPDQLVWLTAQVAQGEFASIEDGARQLIDAGIRMRAGMDDDDLAWAKPLVDGAIAAVNRGEIVSLEDHQARMQAVLGGFKD